MFALPASGPSGKPSTRCARDTREIRCPVLLLWGEDDVTFPVALAEPMAAQFGGPTTFVRIPHASLMPHEERPEAVLASLLPFLESR